MYNLISNRMHYSSLAESIDSVAPPLVSLAYAYMAMAVSL